MVCLNTTLASSSDGSCIVTALPQSFYLLSDKRKVVTKEREVSSAEIQAEEDLVCVSLSDPS